MGPADRGRHSAAQRPGRQHALGPFGTSGKLTDSTTGITVLGARAYNADEGRFLSVDPVQGGCANEYVYVFGDPLNHADPTGQALFCRPITPDQADKIAYDRIGHSTASCCTASANNVFGTHSSSF